MFRVPEIETNLDAMTILNKIKSVFCEDSQSQRKVAESVLESLLNEAADLIDRNDLMQAETVLKRCYDISPDNENVRSELFNVYQKNLVALKRSKYMDYPLFVSVETQTLCN